MINYDNYEFVDIITLLQPAILNGNKSYNTIRKIVVRNKTTHKQELWDIPTVWLDIMKHEYNNGVHAIKKQIREMLLEGE